MTRRATSKAILSYINIRNQRIFLCHMMYKYITRGARWSSGQCARRASAEAKHRSQWPVLGWVTKIYYLELFRASEGTLSRWSRLHLQSLAPIPVSRRVDVRQAAGRKIIAESLSQHDKYMLYRPHLVG
jgi:hypothetical protein